MITKQNELKFLEELIKDTERIESLLRYGSSKDLSLIRLAQHRNNLGLLKAHVSIYADCDICEKTFKSADLVFDINSPDIMCKKCYKENDNLNKNLE
ncbi:MAG: hypothetical protein Q8P20_01150 [bacterium]|nr:hypothetical protein [bacterium]